MIRFILTEARRLQALLVLLAIARAVVLLVPVYLTKTIIDEHLVSRDEAALGLAVAGLVGAVALGGALSLAYSVTAKRLELHFVTKLRDDMVRALLSAPPNYIAETSVGRVMNRVMHDASRFGHGIQFILVQPVMSVVGALAYLLFMLSTSVQLALAVAATVVLSLLLLRRLNRRLGEQRTVVVEAAGNYSSELQEVLAGAPEIQRQTAEEYEAGRLNLTQGALNGAVDKEAWLLAQISAHSMLLAGIGSVIALGAGGLMVTRGSMTVGAVMAFAGAVAGFTSAFDGLIQFAPMLRNMLDRYEEIRRIRELAPLYAGDEGLRATETKTALRFEGVGFQYEEGRPVLANLSVEIAAGEHVALVGPSGCGKSTVLGLAAGALVANTGSVEVFGTDPTQLGATGRTTTFGTVGQHPFLFHGTVRYNAEYRAQRSAAPDAIDEERLLDVCVEVGLDEDLIFMGLNVPPERFDPAELEMLHKVAAKVGAAPDGDEDGDTGSTTLARLIQADPTKVDSDWMKDWIHSFYLSCPASEKRALMLRGLEHEVGHGGSRLSGGQRQKTSLIRVLAAAPRILLLDEVTAALDQSSNNRVHESLRDYRDQTVLAVTHRLEQLHTFDRVLVFDRGLLVDDGPPDVVMASGRPAHKLLSGASSTDASV